MRNIECRDLEHLLELARAADALNLEFDACRDESSNKTQDADGIEVEETVVTYKLTLHGIW